MSDSTAEIVERDRRYFLHPHQVFDTSLVDEVLPIERGAAAQLVDTEGPRSVDAVMVGDVRSSHLMACLGFVADHVTGGHYTEELDVGKLGADAWGPRGPIVRPMVQLTMMPPPLVIDRDDVDHIVATLRGAIVEVRAQLAGAGHI